MKKKDVFDVFDKVREIVVKQLEVKEREVIPEAKFIDDLGADSLDTVEMTMSIEDIFGIEIPDEDAEMLITVGDVINYIIQGKKSLQGKEKKEKKEFLQINYSI